MSLQSEETSSVLELFGLEKENVQSATYSNLNGDACIDIFLMPSDSMECPECGGTKHRVKNYVLKRINHSILTDRRCTIHYHARRYECSLCHRTFYEHNPFTFKSSRISVKTVMQVLDDLKNQNETFTSVAVRHNLSPTTVASIFDHHVQVSRKPLPERLNFDECYAMKTKGSAYVCMLVDHRSAQPIDLLPSRRKDHLVSYFQNIPLEERKNVKVCCFDMYDTYRSVMKMCLPNAIGIVDRFHMIQELTRRIDRIRIRVMKKFGGSKKDKTSDEYYLLKRFSWLLYKNAFDEDKYGSLLDPNRNRLYNQHFKTNLNYYEIRNKLFAVDPVLKTASDIRDSFNDFYNKSTKENAAEKLNEMIETFRTCDIPELTSFAQTLIKWHNEILNYFGNYGYYYTVNQEAGRVVPQNIRISNAIIENRNAILKILKKNANGYTNFVRFRNRALYVLIKDERPTAYPMILKEDKTR